MFFSAFLYMNILFYNALCFSDKEEEYPLKFGDEKRANILNLLGSHKYHSSDSNDIYSSCAICLDDFNENCLYRKLPCKHNFHVFCIDPWIIEKSELCPLCKKTVLVDL